MTSALTSKLRRLLRHGGAWRYNCDRQADPAWEERSEEAVALLRSAGSALPTAARLQVGDLGAGNQRLLRVLERDLVVPFDYHPYDLHPQARGVHRIDVQQELPGRAFDVVFCLGLLEYLRDLDDFAARLRTICRHAVVSYVITDASESLASAERRKRGWESDYTQADVEEFFFRHSYTRAVFTLTNAGSTGLWLWVVGRGDAQASRA